jgi:hypothetical protein
MVVDDLAEVAPDVDDVDAGVRSRAAPELRQCPPTGLHDAEGEREVVRSGSGEPERVEAVLASRLHRDRR